MTIQARVLLLAIVFNYFVLIHISFILYYSNKSVLNVYSMNRPLLEESECIWVINVYNFMYVFLIKSPLSRITKIDLLLFVVLMMKPHPLHIICGPFPSYCSNTICHQQILSLILSKQPHY